MENVKRPFTYEEQIEKLRSRGCIIQDAAFCEDVLKSIGYYRFSAYFLPYKDIDNNYAVGLTFEKVFNVYEFDRKMRNLLFTAIETAEVSLRSCISYYHSHKYGSLGYLDPSTFNNKHDHGKFEANIQREIDNSKNVLFVKHHMEKYGGQFPLWVIAELFTFGTLSFFYNDLKTADKKAFAGKDYKNMVSWLRCCTDLRNICAHYGRLYYRIFSAMPSGFDIPTNQKCRLWGAMLALRAIYPSPEKWNAEFMARIDALIEEYKDVISLHHIAFPYDWKKTAVY